MSLADTISEVLDHHYFFKADTIWIMENFTKNNDYMEHNTLLLFQNGLK